MYTGPTITTDGLVLYLDAANERSYRGEPTVNIIPYTDYSDKTYNYAYSANAWGGDAATIYYYSSGGYNNMPYKKHVKTVVGTGGTYLDDHRWFTIENNKTYAVSCWMKSNQIVTPVTSAYNLTLNRQSDNACRTCYPTAFNLTPEWQRIVWIYNSGSDHYGTDYQVRSLVYDDVSLPLEIYFCGMQVEEQPYVTPFVNGTRGATVSTGGGFFDLSKTGNNGDLSLIAFDSDNLGSITLDGTQYVSCGTDSSLNLTTTGTLSVWMKVTDWAGSNDYWGALWIGGSAGFDTNGYTIWAYSDEPSPGVATLYGTIANRTPVEHWQTSRAFGLSTTLGSSIHNYVLTWNSTTVYIYLDGEYVSQSAYAYGAGDTTGKTFYLGRNELARQMIGNIYNASVYDRLLSADEVEQNFNALRARYSL